MEVVNENVNGVTITKVTGSIESTNGHKLASFPCLKNRDQDMVLDLAEVDFMDSMGLGVLVGIIRGFGAADKRLILAAPASVVMKSLKMTGIDRIVEITGSVVEAAQKIRN